MTERNHAGDGELVPGDGACFIDTENVDGGGIFRGAEGSDQNASFGEFLRAVGQAGGEYDREGPGIRFVLQITAIQAIDGWGYSFWRPVRTF